MSIRNKLYLVILVPVIALLFYSFSSIIQNYSMLSNMRSVETIVKVSSQVSHLVHEMQKERGMTAGFIGSGGSDFVSEIKSQRKLTDTTLAELNVMLKTMSGDMPEKYLKELDSALTGLNNISRIRSGVDSLSIAMNEAVGYYTDNNEQMLRAVNHSSNFTSSVEVSRALASYGNFLMSKERAGIERAVLTNTFAKDEFGKGLYEQFMVLIAQQDSYIEAFEHTADEQLKQILADAEKDSSFSAVAKYRQTAIDHSVEGGFNTSPKEWFDTVSKKINVLKNADDSIGGYVYDIASKKRAEATGSMILNTVIALICIAAVVALLLIIRFTVVGNLSRFIKLTGELNSGDADLTKRIQVKTKDEFAALADNINVFIGSIQEIVDEVKEISDSLASSSSEFAATSEELSSTFDEQTGQVNDMASAMEEMNITSHTINGHIEDVKSVTMDASISTEKGNRQLEDVVNKINSIKASTNELGETISRLNMSSNEIGNIVGAISDIADQTNLLALNAAIEAARAGEAGRGFAVVADEVRKLAEKTQDSTRQIVDIINILLNEAKNASGHMEVAKESVEAGVAVVQETSEVFRQIEGAVSKVKSANDFVSVSIGEQAQAINDSTENTSQVSMGIQESASAVQQINATVADLEKQAISLNNAISRFRT